MVFRDPSVAAETAGEINGSLTEFCHRHGNSFLEILETPEQCAAVLRRYKDGGDWTPDDMTRGLFYRGVE